MMLPNFMCLIIGFFRTPSPLLQTSKKVQITHIALISTTVDILCFY